LPLRVTIVVGASAFGWRSIIPIAWSGSPRSISCRHFYAWETMDWRRALDDYHWLFLAQPAGVPEHLIGCDPEFYVKHLLDSWAGNRAALDDDAVADYLRAFRRPSVIAASCADYRAGVDTDVVDDRADRDAGRGIRCPVVVVWGRGYLADQASSPLEAWRPWADQVSEVVLDCGHFVAEEEPAACADALTRFFAIRQPQGNGVTSADYATEAAAARRAALLANHSGRARESLSDAGMPQGPAASSQPQASSSAKSRNATTR
jgi:pimeloyl-ACP methyl ester carboxylesterase